MEWARWRAGGNVGELDQKIIAQAFAGHTCRTSSKFKRKPFMVSVNLTKVMLDHLEEITVAEGISSRPEMMRHLIVMAWDRLQRIKQQEAEEAWKQKELDSGSR